MQTSINDISIDYLDQGNKSNPTIILLHGWSLYKEKYTDLIKLLSKKFRVIALDFPGFGHSDIPLKPWNNQDYTNFLNKFLASLNITKYILIGHSFGGRIILKYASKNPKNIKKIILIGSSGIERKSLKVKIQSTISNFLPASIKKLLLPFFGSTDYLNANGIMRQIFKNVVNENFESDISKIKIPTLLIWGENDNTTPVWQAKIINKLISNSKLIIIPEANHSLPYKKPLTVAKIIKQFLK